MESPIFLDHHSTTPIDPDVFSEMIPFLTQNFGNASSSHIFGQEARRAVEKARVQVANLIGANPQEIIFTSGATESDNLAIKGAARFNRKKGNHIITSKVEHKAVLDSCRQLEREVFEVTYLDPDTTGIIKPEELIKNIKDETILVSLMHVNNEIGVINDIAELGEVTRKNGLVFHVDAAQSTGKVPIDLANLKVDLMSFSAHKTYGPKGVGALFVRRKPRVRLEAMIHGGGHERGMRSGTLPTHQIVGMGEAFKLAEEEMSADNARISALREKFWQGLKDIEEVRLNGHEEKRVAGFLNVSFNFIEGESLIMALKDIAVSSGSACTSASLEPSYVLRALGLKDELAHSSIRFALGRFTTEQEVDYTINLVKDSVTKLRELSPLWDMYQDGIDLDKVEWVQH